jgi:hypothetical protein
MNCFKWYAAGIPSQLAFRAIDYVRKPGLFAAQGGDGHHPARFL